MSRRGGYYAKRSNFGPPAYKRKKPTKKPLWILPHKSTLPVVFITLKTWYECCRDMWHVIGHHWGPMVLLWDVICARLPFVIRIQCIAVCCWTMLDVTQLKCTVAMVCYARILQEFMAELAWIESQCRDPAQGRWRHITVTTTQLDRCTGREIRTIQTLTWLLEDRTPFISEDLWQVNSVAHHS